MILTKNFIFRLLVCLFILSAFLLVNGILWNTPQTNVYGIIGMFIGGLYFLIFGLSEKITMSVILAIIIFILTCITVFGPASGSWLTQYYNW